MRPSELNFKRRFSVNLYKNLRLKTAEMSMCKDWVNDQRGDPYTVMYRSGDIKERVFGGNYSVSSEKGGKISRLLCSFFPICTYEFKIKEADACAIGFEIVSGERKISVKLVGSEVATVDAPGEHYEFDCKAKPGDVCSVTFRSGGLSLYIKRNLVPELICDVSIKALDDFISYDVFNNATVSLVTEIFGKGKAKYTGVEGYLCGGLSHADMKPMKYEDGTPIIENGRVYMTMSSRLEVGCYQSIISWNPTLCDFKLEGAILYDVGDGRCESDVAASVVYDRNAKKWYIWYCSFSHGHILARGTLKGDPRFGIQIVDAELLPVWSGNDRTEFAGIEGDEDPDLCFIDGKWHLTVCRLDYIEEGKREYRYYHFVSDDPLDGFKYVDRTATGGKTGGMMTLLDGKYYFVCGTDFNSRANYDVYDYDDFSKREKLKCDYDDGGFRGWGTLFCYPSGSRERVYWITFDRHNASKWNWSYGNIYVYEATK